MLPEQIPGSLFVILAALAAFMIGEPGVILGLALGCAAGWWGMIEEARGPRQYILLMAVSIWAIAFLYLVWKVLF